jgi:hypothetical protein
MTGCGTKAVLQLKLMYLTNTWLNIIIGGMQSYYYQDFVINLHPLSGFSTRPMGDILKVEIGFSEKGPKTLPIIISLSKLISVSALCVSTFTRFVDHTDIQGPVY